MAEAAAYLAAATKATGVSDLVSVILAIMMAATAAVASAVASAVATLAAATMATAIDVGGCDDGNGDDKCVCDLMTVISIDVGGCDDGNGDVGVAFSLSVFPGLTLVVELEFHDTLLVILGIVVYDVRDGPWIVRLVSSSARSGRNVRGMNRFIRFRGSTLTRIPCICM